MRVGYEWVHSIVDDHSRYAYCELHRDEKAATARRSSSAPRRFAAEGITPRRLMTDNAWIYTRNRSLADLLAATASATS